LPFYARTSTAEFQDPGRHGRGSEMAEAVMAERGLIAVDFDLGHSRRVPGERRSAARPVG
jgi:hypothetical protein